MVKTPESSSPGETPAAPAVLSAKGPDRVRSAPWPLAGPLVDAFGRVHDYLRISVTDRCNLRCAYCMPPDGIAWKPRHQLLTFEEIARLTSLLARLGVTKIRLTGGEPLVRQGLEELIARLAALPGIQVVGLTTNGVLLAGRVAALRAAGVTHLNISLDTLRRSRFEKITRRDDFAAVLSAVEASLGAGFQRLKVNAVVMGGFNDDELLEFVRFVEHRPIGLRFIEYMPFTGNGWSQATLVPYARMRQIIEQHFRLIPLEGQPSAVAREFAIDGFAGSVGFITSMTDDFCGTCSRLRLTADGCVRPCLHDPAEVSLLEPLRRGAGDGELADLIREVLQRKPEKHAPAEQLVQVSSRSMIQIGG